MKHQPSCCWTGGAVSGVALVRHVTIAVALWALATLVALSTTTLPVLSHQPTADDHLALPHVDYDSFDSSPVPLEPSYYAEASLQGVAVARALGIAVPWLRSAESIRQPLDLSADTDPTPLAAVDQLAQKLIEQFNGTIVKEVLEAYNADTVKRSSRVARIPFANLDAVCKELSRLGLVVSDKSRAEELTINAGSALADAQLELAVAEARVQRFQALFDAESKLSVRTELLDRIMQHERDVAKYKEEVAQAQLRLGAASRLQSANERDGFSLLFLSLVNYDLRSWQASLQQERWRLEFVMLEWLIGCSAVCILCVICFAWTYYPDALSAFCLHHWRKRSESSASADREHGLEEVVHSPVE